MNTRLLISTVLLLVAGTGAATASNGTGWLQLAATDRLSTQGGVQACTPDRPYRCPNGICGRGPGDCGPSGDPSAQRPTNAQGCTADRPYRCPSGVCGRGPGDCGPGGDPSAQRPTNAQGCTADRPYRCPGGDCVKGAGDCPRPLSPTPYKK